MKFPNDLSKERLSLLSKEDRAIYESERKQRNEEKIQRIFADNSVMEALSEDIFEDVDEEDDTEYFINDEMDVLYEKMLAEIMPIEEFNEAKSEVLSLFDSIQEEKQPINEGAEGQDPYAWVKGLKLGWLGKLAMGGLTILGTGIYALLVAGKDKLAMEKLKYYMNRLVEVTDMGLHKKRPFYSKFGFTKKFRQNTGEYNTGCFRTIQETADRNMCNSVMNAAHKLGYFNSGSMMDISNGAAPQQGGGLSVFNDNVLSKLNQIVRPRGVEN